MGVKVVSFPSRDLKVKGPAFIKLVRVQSLPVRCLTMPYPMGVSHLVSQEIPVTYNEKDSRG